MRYRHLISYAGLLMATLLLVSCGGANSGDVFPMAATTVTPTSGPDSFLIFPNPQKQPDGTLQTNTTAYATAYYAAIDPGNTRDTLDKWKAANGFGDLTTGTETTVVFGDVRDLGYGRRMIVRNITSGPNKGTIAVMVENYLVSAATNYGYSSFNLDAAVVQDQRWHVGTNAIEFSASACTSSDPASCVTANSPTPVKFAKFFTFDPATGKRLLAANLDGRGDKAMPSICITCHGGRGDPLTPAAGSPTGKPLFPWVGNSASQKRADVQAHMQPLIVDSFGYSTTPGYTRADQEARLKAINELVLSSYPIPASTIYPEDANRRITNGNEWNGTAAAIIKAAYGGDGLPNATFSDSYVPANWSSMGQTAMYKNVVVPYCRTCHIQRGVNAYGINDLDFDHYCSQTTPGTCDTNAVNPYNSYFYGYASRIKAHVLDRGNMPLAKIVYQRFWGSNDPDTLATFLQAAQTEAVRDSSGALLKPGRPVADPGPDRTTDSPATLSAANSLFATTYAWSIVSGAGGTLGNASSAQATLSGIPGTTYGVQLVVGNGTTQSAPVTVNVKIATAGTMELPIAASAIRFSDIKAILQDNVPVPGGGSTYNTSYFQNCTSCHVPSGGPPIFYNDYDRNGDGSIDSGSANSIDDRWFYSELRGRINFTDVAASPLLRKPTGHHHGGGLIFDMANTTPCAASPTYPSCQPYATLGDYYKAQYNKIVLWMLNGAPY
ncbi:MAG: hypothetical protein LJE57_10870 [Gallionella sp.]|nr:hypothetical protein [Gallionella sp.]